MALTFNIKKLGGTGSGNFGHGGRKGEVGGSSKEGSGAGGSIPEVREKPLRIPHNFLWNTKFRNQREEMISSAIHKDPSLKADVSQLNKIDNELDKAATEVRIADSIARRTISGLRKKGNEPFNSANVQSLMKTAEEKNKTFEDVERKLTLQQLKISAKVHAALRPPVGIS